MLVLVVLLLQHIDLFFLVVVYNQKFIRLFGMGVWACGFNFINIKRCWTILNWQAGWLAGSTKSPPQTVNCINIIFVPSCVHLWNFRFHFFFLFLLNAYCSVLLHIRLNYFDFFFSNNILCVKWWWWLWWLFLFFYFFVSSTASYVWFIFCRWIKNGVNCI